LNSPKDYLRKPRNVRAAVRLLALATTLLFVPRAGADWINLTGAETAPNIAEITFVDDGVQVNLEVYVGDLDSFAELIPDDWIKDSGQRLPLTERMRRFADSTFGFQRDDGSRLSVELNLVEPRLRVDRQSPFAGMINPITRQRLP
jgi:hypothetical protein